MKHYIEFRVYIQDDQNIELVEEAAKELQDTLHDTIGDICITYNGDFIDLSDVLKSGDVTYEIHTNGKEN